MTVHKTSDSIQRSGCTILHNLRSCPDSSEADVMGRASAIVAMTCFPLDVRIQFLGGKILCQAGANPVVALLGGLGALARAMRVCATSQDFQTDALKGMIPLLDGYVEHSRRRGEAAARFWEGVLRQGLASEPSLVALRAAREEVSARRWIR